MMKARRRCLKTIVAFALLLCFGFGLAFLSPIKQTCADVFSDVTVPTEENSPFSMRMTAVTRKAGAPLNKDIRTVTTNSGSINYYCFKWSEIETLCFHFSAANSATCISHEFVVSYIPSETLTSVFSSPESVTQTLYSGQDFSPFEFYYYIDKASHQSTSSNTKYGFGFGLYKFDFKFKYAVDGKEPEISIGEIYVAILPDDIDSIQIPINSQIVYSISSSNKLLNVYNLQLSYNLQYVNPKHLHWEVFGEDVDGVSYCLDKHMQERLEYGNHQVIWPSYLPEDKITGANFTFDSNDIEGIWTAVLTITDSDENVKASFKVGNLSTIKVAKKSYLWLILLIIFLVLLIVATLIFIIYISRKKKEKVW